MDYNRKACNTLFIKNGKQSSFPDNDSLISSALCDKNFIKCIMGVCSTCKTFPEIDTLAISSLKCSKSCYKENKDCTKHTIKVYQFQRVAYNHKRKEKKRLKLVDKMITPSDLVLLLKTKLNRFPVHTFNVQQIAKTYDKIISNLNEHSILKIHNFWKTMPAYYPKKFNLYNGLRKQLQYTLLL